MNDIFAQIKEYLPKFLSEEKQTALFKELNQFPDNIDQRLYSRRLSGDQDIYQGDAVENLPIMNLPQVEIRMGMCIVLTNTCDICPDNESLLGARISYCPMVKLAKLRALVEKVKPSGAADFIDSVKKQKVATLLYFPQGGRLSEESVALLDHTLNCPVDKDAYIKFASDKVFTLSDYGFYLFLFKLSIHLTRIRDGIERGGPD